MIKVTNSQLQRRRVFQFTEISRQWRDDAPKELKTCDEFAFSQHGVRVCSRDQYHSNFGDTLDRCHLQRPYTRDRENSLSLQEMEREKKGYRAEALYHSKRTFVRREMMFEIRDTIKKSAAFLPFTPARV